MKIRSLLTDNNIFLHFFSFLYILPLIISEKDLHFLSSIISQLVFGFLGTKNSKEGGINSQKRDIY